MTALHILTCEYPPDIGGVSDYTRQVAEALAAAGEAVHVWCPPAGGRAASAVKVHAEAGRFRPSDLRRLATGLNTYPSPRRLLVQWVPHGYGWRSMNVWLCLWLARRAMSGDVVELMVHEPFIELKRGPLRHIVMALVHRVMTLVLMQSVTRVWLAIPAWESLLRPFTLGRQVRMDWLPIPGGGGPRPSEPVASVREQYAEGTESLLGHFGSYGGEISALLEERLALILAGNMPPAILLIGEGSERFRNELMARHPAWAARVRATGYVPSTRLDSYLTACDVFLQPYPDGISSRRTSAMACLLHGRPVVTTSGHLTESFWAESDAVALARVDDPRSFAEATIRLVEDPIGRDRLGQSARRLYKKRFDLSHTVAALRAA